MNIIGNNFKVYELSFDFSNYGNICIMCVGLIGNYYRLSGGPFATNKIQDIRAHDVNTVIGRKKTNSYDEVILGKSSQCVPIFTISKKDMTKKTQIFLENHLGPWLQTLVKLNLL